MYMNLILREGFMETEKEEVVKLEQSYAIEMLNITKPPASKNVRTGKSRPHAV